MGVVLQRDELSDEELESSENILRQWHSAKAVLLLLREELQQMRNFIDGLHVHQIQCNDLSGSRSHDCQVQGGPAGLDDVDKALRVVCDRLDALVIVIDVVLDDRATEMFDTEFGRTFGSALISEGVQKSTVQDKDASRENFTPHTENRQLFDQLVSLMQQTDEIDTVQHNSHSQRHVTAIESHCQMPQTEWIQSNKYSEDFTDTDHVTEANSSNESSYTTCNGSSSGSASPNAQHQSISEEIMIKCALNTNEALICDSLDVMAEDLEPPNSEVDECPKLHANLSDTIGAFLCKQHSHKHALELLHKEQSLLQLQQQTNIVLHRELVQLSDDSRKLQDIIADLGTSLVRKNNEVMTLRNKMEHVNRLLDEQVEEFRCVFRAVTLESDEELERLVVENSRLRSALASQDTIDGFNAEESTKKKLSGDNTYMHEQAHLPCIREHLGLVQEKNALTEEKKNGISREDEVAFPQQFDDSSSPQYTKLEKAIPVQGSPLVQDYHISNARLVVPMDYVEDLWSEIEALKKTVFEQGHYLFTKKSNEHEQYVPGTDLNDSGAATCTGSVVGDGDRELELTEHLSLNNVFSSGRVLHPCIAPSVSFHDSFYISRTGDYLGTNHEDMNKEGKLTKKKPLLGLNRSVNKTDVSHINSGTGNTSFIGTSWQVSHLPAVKQTQTNRLSRSVSDSCIQSQINASASHKGDRLSSSDLDYSSGKIYEFQHHPCSTSYHLQHYQQRGINMRSAATQTKLQGSTTDMHADIQPEEDGLETFDQAYMAFNNDITKLYSSLKSELQRLQDVMIRDDFAIHGCGEEDFSSVDLQSMVAHFKHHIDQKIMLNEENCLMVKEISQLLSELLKLCKKRNYAHLSIDKADTSFYKDSKVTQTRHDEEQLQTTVFGQSGFMTSSIPVKQHCDCSETDSPLFLPVKSSLCTTLSVLCIERPLVIDLSTNKAIRCRPGQEQEIEAQVRGRVP